jgi:hypothetical protein
MGWNLEKARGGALVDLTAHQRQINIGGMIQIDLVGGGRRIHKQEKVSTKRDHLTYLHRHQKINPKPIVKCVGIPVRR